MSLLDLINKVIKSKHTKCTHCKKVYDKKSRFVKLMQESDERDYRKILEFHEYCSDECLREDTDGQNFRS